MNQRAVVNIPEGLPNLDVARQRLVSLKPYYTLLGDDRLIVEMLAESPILHSLLIAAVKPLYDAFGERRIIQIRAQSSDEDNMLKALVQLPPEFEQPEMALRSFDKNWWLDNCQRSGGALVFDYEIRDGRL